MARPKKTTKDLPKDWKKIVLANMKVGASKQEIKLELAVSNDLFERLCKEDKEFSDTIKRGVDLAEGWWLKQGRINLENKMFSPVLWYMNMKNRFGWVDKQQLEHFVKPLTELHERTDKLKENDSRRTLK